MAKENKNHFSEKTFSDEEKSFMINQAEFAKNNRKKEKSSDEVVSSNPLFDRGKVIAENKHNKAVNESETKREEEKKSFTSKFQSGVKEKIGLLRDKIVGTAKQVERRFSDAYVDPKDAKKFDALLKERESLNKKIESFRDTNVNVVGLDREQPTKNLEKQRKKVDAAIKKLEDKYIEKNPEVKKLYKNFEERNVKEEEKNQRINEIKALYKKNGLQAGQSQEKNQQSAKGRY